MQDAGAKPAPLGIHPVSGQGRFSGCDAARIGASVPDASEGSSVMALRWFLCLAVLTVSACAAQGAARVAAVPPQAETVPIPVAKDAATVVRVVTGEASWYGPRFDGRTTASGEPFDMDALTAAHRTLPFDTRVRVVNESNGRAVTVRINDRGPYADGRVIDLSRRAADEIGLIGRGVGEVRLEVLEREPHSWDRRLDG